MSRNRRVNWERANARDKVRDADRVSGPERLYVKRWLLRHMKWEGRCDTCGEPVIVGERAYMQRGDDRWLFRHQACHSP